MKHLRKGSDIPDPCVILSLAMGPSTLPKARLRLGTLIQHRYQGVLEECSDSVSPRKSMAKTYSRVLKPQDVTECAVPQLLQKRPSVGPQPQRKVPCSGDPLRSSHALDQEPYSLVQFPAMYEESGTETNVKMLL